jgi:hypothetical protein
VGATGRLGLATRAALERSYSVSGHIDVDIAKVVWCVIFEPDSRGRSIPPDARAGADRWELVQYEGRYAEASEAVASSLLLVEAER